MVTRPEEIADEEAKGVMKTLRSRQIGNEFEMQNRISSACYHAQLRHTEWLAGEIKRRFSGSEPIAEFICAITAWKGEAQFGENQNDRQERKISEDAAS